MENTDKKLAQQRGYIVLDCVANNFNEEVPYSNKKDYPMDLNRLDGLGSTPEFISYKSVDASELFGLGEPQIVKVYITKDGKKIGEDAQGNHYELSESINGLGKISLRKIAKGAFNTIKDVAKVVTIPVRAPIQTAVNVAKGKNLKDAIKATVAADKKDLKKVGDVGGKVFRFVNRFVDPVTILLRNGVLEIMKINLFNIAKRIRFAFWDEATALKHGWEKGEFEKLQKVKDKLETIYWQAGGKKEILQHAILTGKGNRDGKVAKPGQAPTEFNDPEEAKTLISGLNGNDGMGVLPAAAIGAATTAMAAVAKILNSIKSPKDGNEPDEVVPTGDPKVDQLQQTISKVTTAVKKVKNAKDKIKSITSKLKKKKSKGTTAPSSSSSTSAPSANQTLVAEKDQSQDSPTPEITDNNSLVSTDAMKAADNSLVIPTTITPTTSTTQPQQTPAKSNATPWIVGAGVVGVIAFAMMRNSKSSAKSLNGFEESIKSKSTNKKKKKRAATKTKIQKVETVNF
jgi:hypothetical protein